MNYYNSRIIGQIDDVQGLATINTFAGFSERSYLDISIGGNGFIFITSPRLFLDITASSNVEYSEIAYNNMLKDPRLSKYIQKEIFNKKDREIVKLLSFNKAYHSSGFIPLLTNLCRGIDPTEINLETTEAFASTHGFRQQIPTNTVLSRASTQLVIPFTETANHDITKLIELWVTYIELISEGTILPNPRSVLNGEYDYVSDIYYILLGPDGQTIKHYTKWTGCYPINIPYSRMNYSKGERQLIDVDITFNCIGGVEHNNPAILEELNMASLMMDNTSAMNMSSIVENEIGNDSESNEYAVVKESKLLNPAKLNVLAGNVINKLKNNPLVFVMTDPRTNNSRFVLTFGSDSFEADTFVDLLKNSDIESGKDLLGESKLHYGTPIGSPDDVGDEFDAIFNFYEKRRSGY